MLLYYVESGTRGCFYYSWGINHNTKCSKYKKNIKSIDAFKKICKTVNINFKPN